MKCPFCGNDNDKVIDSRSGEEGHAIRRRRRCLECKQRFTTYERVAEVDVKVIKKSGERAPFRPDKLRQGIERACWKRKVSGRQISEVVARVEQAVYSQFSGEIESEELGKLVMRELYNLDDVAYIRFASVYHDFNDVNDFVHELQPILRKSK